MARTGPRTVHTSRSGTLLHSSYGVGGRARAASWRDGPMPDVPPELLHGPFTRAHALALGVTARVLEGVRFRRLHHGVYVHRSHELTWADEVEAARLALPSSARTTGATRLREAGFDAGDRWPLHFVVEGDLHLTLDRVILHRTVKMPASDDNGVSIEAAFVAFCAGARLLDAIRVGSVLLNKGALDLGLLGQMLHEEPWRRGVPETAYAVPHLEGRCRSMPEAELFAYVVFAELPEPQVNQQVELEAGVQLTPDLWFQDYGLVVEYEGSQHQEDRAQYNADIDRYALYRRHGVPYEQVTKERMRSPRATVRVVHAALVSEGYAGPPPVFGAQWATLFEPLATLVRRTRAG